MATELECKPNLLEVLSSACAWVEANFVHEGLLPELSGLLHEVLIADTIYLVQVNIENTCLSDQWHCSYYTDDVLLSDVVLTRSSKILSNEKGVLDPLVGHFFQQRYAQVLQDKNGGVIAVLVLNSREHVKVFSSAEQTLIRLLAQFLTTKLETIFAQRDIVFFRNVQTENLQKALFDIAELSTRTIDVMTLYDHLHSIVKRLFVAENFVIARYLEETEHISIEYFVDEVDIVPEKKQFPLGIGMTSFVFRSKKAQLINQARLKDLIACGEISRVVGNATMSSWMGAPMILNDTIIGVVIVQSYNEDVLYNDKELTLLSFVANHMATVLRRFDSDMALSSAHQALELQNEELRKRSAEQEFLIAKLQETQNQLIQSEKMASVGQLAAGIAHEINNPIGFINSNVVTLRDYMDTLITIEGRYKALLEGAIKTPHVSKQLHEIQQDNELAFIRDDMDGLFNESLDGLRRVKEIVQSLRDFSRVSEMELSEADIHQGINSALKIVCNGSKYKLQIEKDFADIAPLKCNISQLSQVFLNMLINASHAIKDTGVISITTGEANGEVWIQFSDDGEGIAPENLNKIFEPFFTTKPVGSGTGLGLSISYGIVQKHNGRIEVVSKLGEGTSFTIYLPRNVNES